MKKIKLKGICSTVSVMEYIRDNGFTRNEYGNMYFEFHDDCMNERIMGIPTGLQPRYLIVSEHDMNDSCFLDLHPLEDWHDVFGMKRIKISCGWYIYINGEYYFMSC